MRKYGLKHIKRYLGEVPKRTAPEHFTDNYKGSVVLGSIASNHRWSRYTLLDNRFELMEEARKIFHKEFEELGDGEYDIQVNEIFDCKNLAQTRNQFTAVPRHYGWSN